MTIESSVTAAIASFLLSLFGIPSASVQDYILVAGAHRPLQVQMGLFDWATLILLDFFYIFATWTYVTVRGGELGSKRYFGLAVLALPVLFLGNALKTFVQAYVAVTSGTLSISTGAEIASMDAAGLAALFGIVLLSVAVTCMFVGKTAASPSRWPMSSLGARKMP